MSNNSKFDSTWYVLVLVAAFAAAGAISGYDRGWAYAEKDDFKPKDAPLAPGVDLSIRLGWWNHTSAVNVADFLPKLHVQGDAAKGLGAVTISFMAASVLLSLYLLWISLAETCKYTLPRSLVLAEGQRVVVAGVISGLLLFQSLALYAALAIGLDQKLKSDFGHGLIARPDWAFASAILAASCWFGITRKISAARSFPEGYLPM